MLLSAISDHPSQIERGACNHPGMVAQKHAQQRGDLIVARPASAEAATDLRAYFFQQQSLQRSMHVFIRRIRLQVA